MDTTSEVLIVRPTRGAYLDNIFQHLYFRRRGGSYVNVLREAVQHDVNEEEIGARNIKSLVRKRAKATLSDLVRQNWGGVVRTRGLRGDADTEPDRRLPEMIGWGAEVLRA